MTNTGVRKTSLGGLLFCLAVACCPAARAEQLEVLPEFDGNLKLSPVVRVTFEAKGEREGGDRKQLQAGPGVRFYLKPLVRLKAITAFDLDDTKSRFLVLELGYRYITTPNSTPEERMITALTSNYPLKGGLLISDRNRADLDWNVSGPWTWRYRNRFQLERTLSISSFHLIPYIAVEPYYESQYGKWSTTALLAGALIPVGKHVQLESYFKHQNNTGGKGPNTQDQEVGLALHLYLANPR